MARNPSAYIESFLCCWSSKVLRFPITLILLTCILAGFSLYYTINNLGVNTNTAQMLSPDLPFQVNRKRLETEFPQDAGAIILVVEAATPEETSIAANQLENQLLAQKDHFVSAYIPTDNEFFRREALLYLDIDELYDLSAKLTDAQPFIGYLSEHYSLQGLLDIILKALENKDKELPMDLNPLLQAINGTAENLLSGHPTNMSWQNLLAAGKLNTDTNRTIVIARPKMKFDEILPAEHALTTARKMVSAIMAANPSVKIRITGETALEHEELESVTRGAEIAGVVSLILVSASLLIALRSVKLLLSTFIALILGLILTAGFAALAIGHLNLISIAFAVLYIGLGVDYAIHLCLHYRECRAQGMENLAAINHSVATVGVSLFLCAITTAIGFLAFIPTDYSGVSELGIISGAGMFIGLTISLTVLPALLKIMPINNVKPFHSRFRATFVTTMPFKYATPIRVLSILFAIISAAILTQLKFDSNPINLRDPSSESVSSIKELLRSQTDSPFSLAALAPDLKSAEQLAEKFQALPSVHDTVILSNLVAENQEEKLYIIEDLAMILGNQLNKFDHELTDTKPLAAIREFVSAVEKHLQRQPDEPSKAELERLLQNFRTLSHSEDANAKAHTLERNILQLLPYTMDRLRTSLTAQAYGLNDLPDYLSAHWVSPSGLYKILITPEFDQNKVENLKQFVTEVQSVDPAATGLPVADQASGVAVVKAFIEAFSGALIAIFVLLLLILRNFRDTLLVLGPLLLAGMLTGAANVVLDNPFNFANIIALPLLMGMGVDSGIHILHRLQSEHFSSNNILESSTARGVFFSSLTTLCSFSSLAFTPHLGVASMGLLLAIGITFTLLCTLIVLPAFYGKQA
ncbi:MMPL family transporter [Methylomarinum vadi]|uniref:MMPL family transporter n=1 Tax=Methylomarinum vadi TaxID=438855 RepID=UPI0004DF92F0|nr:MMPL family transporter [Methylomarinum vadi]